MGQSLRVEEPVNKIIVVLAGNRLGSISICRISEATIHVREPAVTIGRESVRDSRWRPISWAAEFPRPVNRNLDDVPLFTEVDARAVGNEAGLWEAVVGDL